MIDSAVAYVEWCLREALSHGAWGIVLLLAPAIIFDTTRYYLTNTVYFFLHVVESALPKKRREAIPERELPFVSVIVPVHNEGERLRMTLDSIAASDYPRFEILVVDDASSDGTPALAREFQKAGKIRYIRKTPQNSKPSSLNYGLQFARGELTVHVDGDTLLRPDALREAVRPFRDPRVGCVGGNLNVSNAGKNLWTLLQAAEFGMTINVQRRWLSLTDSLQIASGAFGVFRKKVLLSLYGVDTEYGEDLDITIKIRKMGYRVVFCPKAIALTDMPDTLRGIFYQRLRWDRCYIRINLRKHGDLIHMTRFRFTDFMAMVLDFFFNLVLLFVLPVYILLVAVFTPQLAPFILVVTYVYYTLANLVQILIAAGLSEKPFRNLRWLLIVPLYFPYSIYLRIIRATAYTLEAFYSPLLKSQYIPDPVKKQMPEY